MEEATREQARIRVFPYIEFFDDTRRRHSSLGQIGPAEHETRNTPAEATAAELPGVNGNRSTPG